VKRAWIVRPEAETDLARAGRWYQQQAPDLGRRFLAEVGAAFSSEFDRFRNRQCPASREILAEVC